MSHSVVSDHWPAFKALALAVWDKLDRNQPQPHSSPQHNHLHHSTNENNIDDMSDDESDDDNDDANDNAHVFSSSRRDGTGSDGSWRRRSEGESVAGARRPSRRNGGGWGGGDSRDHSSASTHYESPGSSSSFSRRGQHPSSSSFSSGRGEHSGVSEVTIDGHIFRFDLSDRDMLEWMEYYMDFPNYRSRQQLRRTRATRYYRDVVAKTTHR